MNETNVSKEVKPKPVVENDTKSKSVPVQAIASL